MSLEYPLLTQVVAVLKADTSLISYLFFAVRTERISDKQRTQHGTENVVCVAETDFFSCLISFRSKKSFLEFLMNSSEFVAKKGHGVFDRAPHHVSG